MSKRRTHSPEFKARVAMEAISDRKMIQEIAADHTIHPIPMSQWKRQLLDGASELFTQANKSKVKDETQAQVAELFQQIGKGAISRASRQNSTSRLLESNLIDADQLTIMYRAKALICLAFLGAS